MKLFMDIFRFLVGHIDYAIYSLIEWVTQGIFDIAFLRADVSLVETVRNRLYVILGVFMLFKLSISFMGYIVNPESMLSDKEKQKNISGLIGRTILMLIFLILLPTFFSVLYRAQSVFLPVLPRVLLNTTDSGGTVIENTQEAVSQQSAENASNMAIMLLQAFYTPYYDADDDYVQVGGVKEIESLDDFRSTLTDKQGGALGIQVGVLGAEYKYDYKIPFATIVGIITLFLLVSITIDIAARVFKMLVLEMIAPIPVMSYIDPKSSKDGAFVSWIKQLSNTFLDLFFKLGLIYLILFFVRELNNDNLFISYGSAEGTGVNPARKAYLIVFLILGLLKFAKDAPEFIRSIFGIKGKGGEGITKAAAGALGFLSGGATGAVGGLVAGRGLRGAATGAISGATASGSAAAQGKSISGFKAGSDAAIQARTGDKNAKAGILAKAQQAAIAGQSRREASKIGINQQSLDLAKQDMIEKKTLATNAEYSYRELMQQESQFTEADRQVGSAGYAAYQAYETRKNQAYSDWQDKAATSDKAERNFTKAKEIAKSFGVEPSDTQKYKHAMSRTGQAKDAVKAAGERTIDAASTALGGNTIADRRDNRTTKIARKGGFNPDDR